jgi:hypothetical protein
MAAQIKVGTAAKSDPILARSSLIAANIMLSVAKKPPSRRRAALVSELNKASSGLAKTASAEYDRLLAAGVSDNQAMFDAIRLAVANYLADRTAFLMQAGAAREGAEALSGFGLSGNPMDDLQKGFCILGAGGTQLTAGWTESFSGGLIKGGAMMQGAAAAGQTAGCNREQIAQESQVAAQRANEAIRLAEVQGRQEATRLAARSEMIRTLAIGGGVAAIAIVGLVVALK